MSSTFNFQKSPNQNAFNFFFFASNYGWRAFKKYLFLAPLNKNFVPTGLLAGIIYFLNIGELSYTARRTLEKRRRPGIEGGQDV